MSRTQVKLLKPSEVGQLLGFAPRTIARWCREGQFPTADKVGRVWRIPSNDTALLIILSGDPQGLTKLKRVQHDSV